MGLRLRATRLRWILLLLALIVAWPTVAVGLSLFKGVMPGKVAEPHAKTEEKCFECHAAFGKSFTTKCEACHKDVGADRAKRRGFHGLTKTERCEQCHSEHKGREAQLVLFNKDEFDHSKTDYPLDGRHRETACDQCHLKPKFRETPSLCVACHREDDYHKGALGEGCAQCHVASSWKEIRFDHSTTEFPLEGKHQPVRCEQCHVDGLDAKDTPTACVACHRKDDPHKMNLGDRCESCHTAADWKRSTFDHDRTAYRLIGKHQPVKCLACHTTAKLTETPKACVACHKDDDRHRGSLGTECADCHTPSDWTKFRFDHSTTNYPLVAKHREVPCAQCHAKERYTNTPTDCVACHKKDDDHKGLLGTNCDRCHVERGWEYATFDHATTEFPLRDAHIKTKCVACHTTPRLESTPKECDACHRDEDVHKGKLGLRCDTCHNAKTWKKAPTFNHAKTDFPLSGKHQPVACKKCHITKLFADTTTVCMDCHKRDDTHKGRFGRRCEQCHTDKTWERKDFDHKKEAGYALEGAHQKVKCLTCHTRPLFDQKTPTLCGVCHRKDDVHDGDLGRRCERCHIVDTFAIQR